MRVLRYPVVSPTGRFAHGLFAYGLESIRLRLICQFTYESDIEALNLNY